jgi:hypothetical protein
MAAAKKSARKTKTTPRRSTAKKRPAGSKVSSTKAASVVAAVERDLNAIAERDPELAASGIAATALALAREIDKPRGSATAKATCARALADTLERLRQLAPPPKQKDGLDDLTARRAARLAGGTGT